MSNIASAPVGILTRALTGNIFVEKSLAFMNEGDKDGYNVFKHDIKNVLRARTDNPASAAAEIDVKNSFKRSLTVLESYVSFDPSDYYSYWKEYQPAGQFQWEGLPAKVQSVMEELFLGSAQEAVETNLTNDDGSILTANSGAGGLIEQLEDAGYTQLVKGTSATSTQIANNTRIAFRAHGGGSGDYAYAALTTSNIFAKLELMINNQTAEQRKRPGRKFMVNFATADLIMEAQRLELNFKGVDVMDEGVMRYAGYEIIINPSFPNNTLLLCSMTGAFQTDAIQLGTSMSADFNNVEVQRTSNFGRTWGMLLTLALDIFVVRPEEVCFYTPTDAS
jgi:hypothetical protein